MPNIVVKIPHGAFPGEHRVDLVRRINAAAAAAEQLPNDPRKRVLCWVVVEEAALGGFTCGGGDLTQQLLPCMVQVYVPEGVLDAASRSQYVRHIHAALKGAMPAGDARQLASSVLLIDVPEGTWGGNGAIWSLADMAAAAGYTHLQHLVPIAV